MGNSSEVCAQNSSKSTRFLYEYILYLLTIVVAIIAVVAVFVVPDNVNPAAYIRMILDLVLVLFLPGFSFMKALYPSGVPIKTSSEGLDIAEFIVLSLGLSIAITPMVGLALYFSPWGMGPGPVARILLGLVIVFVAIAVFREYRGESVSVKELLEQ